MSDTFTVSDAEGAAQLVAFGMRPRLHPSQDHEYGSLVRRYREDDNFRFLTDRIAFSLGLHMVRVSPATGAVLTAAEGSVFETKIEDYARTSRHRGDGEKALHGIIHLAVAALAFPRPADLDDDGYIGRVKASLVDETVREICRLTGRRTAPTARVRLLLEPHADPASSADGAPGTGSTAVVDTSGRSERHHRRRPGRGEDRFPGGGRGAEPVHRVGRPRTARPPDATPRCRPARSGSKLHSQRPSGSHCLIGRAGSAAPLGFRHIGNLSGRAPQGPDGCLLGDPCPVVWPAEREQSAQAELVQTLAHARDSAGLDRLPSKVQLREARHRADRVA
jgi:hypothetical protein